MIVLCRELGKLLGVYIIFTACVTSYSVIDVFGERDDGALWATLLVGKGGA